MSKNESDLERARKKLAMLDGGNQFGAGGFYDISNKSDTQRNINISDGFRRKTLKKDDGTLVDEDVDDEDDEDVLSSSLEDLDVVESKVLIDELEQSNANNARLIKSKLRRNKVLISVLLILLLVSLTTIIIAYIFLNLDKTCSINIVGDVSAECVVDGHTIKEFRVPSSIKGNRILKLDIDLKIKDTDMYYIKYKAVCYQDENVLANTLIYKPNETMFQAGEDGYYELIEPIIGGQTIDLCGGIIIDYHYEHSLNVNNFSMEFEIIIQKVESINN